MSQLDLYVPQFPRAPRRVGDDALKAVDGILDWAFALNKELIRYTNDIQNKLIDQRLLLKSTRQTVADGFTISPVSAVIELVTASLADIVSDAVAAIEFGGTGQPLIIMNLSSVHVTIKNNALTKFVDGLDYDLRPNAHLFMRWVKETGDWYEVAGS